LAVAGDWENADRLVDLDAKCSRMFGSLYDDGPDPEKVRMRDAWARRLEETTGLYYKHHFKDGPGELSEKIISDGEAEVAQREGRFALLYVLKRTEGTWRIVDRMHELEGVRPIAQKGIATMLSRIEQELGRKPSLSDVNDRLEYYLSRLRLRQYRVGPRPKATKGSAPTRQRGNL